MVSCALCARCNTTVRVRFSLKMKYIASDLFYVEGERLSLKVIMFSGCDGESKKVISDEYQIILQEQLFGAL